MNKYVKTVDIVIPVHNALEYLRPCLDSVLHFCIDQVRQLIVINDGSDHYVSSFLRNFANKNEKVLLIETEKNEGYVKSCNIGLKLSEADIVVLLNSDTIITANFIQKIRGCFDSDDRIGIASPISNNSPHFSIPIFPAYNFHQMAYLVNELSEKRYPDAITPEGFCFCIKKQVIKKIGYFDEVFGLGYCEESDYSMHALSNGFRTVCIDNLYIYHKREGSFQGKREELYRKNRLIFDERWLSLYNKVFVEKMNPSPIKYLRDKLMNYKHPFYGLYLKTNKQILKNLHWDIYIELKRWHEANYFSKALEVVFLKLVGLVANGIRTFKKKYSDRRRKILFNEMLDHYHEVQNECKNIAITFVLPGINYPGGIQSVLNLSCELTLMGLNVKVLVLNRSSIKFDLFFAPFHIGNQKQVLNYFPRSDLVVATSWDTAEVVHLIGQQYGYKTAYFVQDYEVDFFSISDTRNREKAKQSYPLIDNKFAKTGWLVDKMRQLGYSCQKINPGMNLNIFYPPSDRLVKKKLTIIAMWRPSTPRRGSEVLQEALKLVLSETNDIEIILFGEVPGNIGFTYKYLGQIPHNKLAGYYRYADIFIDTSHFHGFGRSGVEAMACGCACVLTNSGGIDEYAINGINALIAEVNHPEDVAAKIIQLIRDENLRNKISKKAIEGVLRFSERNAAEQFLTLANDWTTLG